MAAYCGYKGYSKIDRSDDVTDGPEEALAGSIVRSCVFTHQQIGIKKENDKGDLYDCSFKPEVFYFSVFHARSYAGKNTK